MQIVASLDPSLGTNIASKLLSDWSAHTESTAPVVFHFKTGTFVPRQSSWNTLACKVPLHKSKPLAVNAGTPSFLPLKFLPGNVGEYHDGLSKSSHVPDPDPVRLVIPSLLTSGTPSLSSDRIAGP